MATTGNDFYVTTCCLLLIFILRWIHTYWVFLTMDCSNLLTLLGACFLQFDFQTFSLRAHSSCRSRRMQWCIATEWPSGSSLPWRKRSRRSRLTQLHKGALSLWSFLLSQSGVPVQNLAVMPEAGERYLRRKKGSIQ